MPHQKSRKDHAKKVLKKNFILNKDYNIIVNNTQKQNGGHNKETILLSLNCFKKFCFKAQTKESEKIYYYYLQIEKCIFGYF